MVSSKRSPGARPDPGRRYSRTAPGHVSPVGFEMVAVRSTLSNLAPPTLQIKHGCGWWHDLAQDRIQVGELAALMAAHQQLGCE